MRGWKTILLADALADAKPGFACGEDPPNGVFQFRMNNITTEGRLDLSKKRRVPSDTKKLESFLVEPGDVLFNATNSPELVGKSAYFPGVDEPSVFSNHFLRLRPKANQLNGRFLARWLVMQFQRGVFQGMCRQWVNQATVGRDALLGLQIPLPPLNEQRRIADVLDRAEELLTKRRAALDLLDKLTQAIFLDMFGDPVTNPKGWKCPKFAEIADFENGDRSSNYPSGDEIKNHGILFLSTKNIVDDTLDLSNAVYITPEKFKSLSRGKTRRMDLIITLRGTLGSCCIFDSPHETAFINAQMMIVRSRKEMVPQYLHRLLTSKQSKDRFERIGFGAAVPQLTATQLSTLEIPLPPIAIQKTFAARIAAIETLKQKHKEAEQHTKKLFQALQHKAFRGEL